MEQLFRNNKLIGKTIKSIKEYQYDYMCFIFTDETFCIMSAVHQYDDGPKCVISDEKIKFDNFSHLFEINNLFDYGLIDSETKSRLVNEFNQKELDRIEKNKKLKEKQERETLKKLKEKYPNL